jgi:hypothetical protein
MPSEDASISRGVPDGGVVTGGPASVGPLGRYKARQAPPTGRIGSSAGEHVYPGTMRACTR